MLPFYTDTPLGSIVFKRQSSDYYNPACIEEKIGMYKFQIKISVVRRV